MSNGHSKAEDGGEAKHQEGSNRGEEEADAETFAEEDPARPWATKVRAKKHR